jgi:hypothetical protein
MKMANFFSFLIILLLLYVPVAAEEVSEGKGTKKIDKDYIKKYYPEVYQEIYREGKEAAIKEAEAKERVVKQEPDDQKKAEGMEPSRASLGDWWNRSSLSQPNPGKFLFHTEGAFTGMWLGGNNMGESYKGRGSVSLRRGRFTNTVSYNIAKTKIDQTDGGSTNRNYQLAEEALQFDLTKTFFTVAGVLWEKDSTNYIGDRVIYYGGAGAYVLDSDRFKLKVVGAYGQQHERYNVIVTELIGLREKNTGVLYGYQSFDWQFTKRFSFQEGFRVLWDIKNSPRYMNDLHGGYFNTGEKQRFRTFLHLELDYKITPHFSFLVSSDTRFESVPWPDVKQRDITNTVGVKFSY